MQFDEVVFLEGLKSRPETIRTIVKDEYGPTTTTIIVKRKTNILFRFHLIYEYPLDGVRNGMKLFFHPEKTYTIIIRRTRMGFNTYYCKKVEEKEDGIELTDVFELGLNEWLPKEKILIPQTEVWRCF